MVKCQNYIGLNHYKRYFEFTDELPDLDDIFENYDVILPEKKYLNISVKERYCNRHIYVKILLTH